MAKNQQQQVLDVNEAISKSEAFITKYKRQLVGGLVAVVLVVAAGFFGYQFYSQRNAKGQAQLSMGVQLMAQAQQDSTAYTKALNGDGQFQGFLKMQSSFSMTPAANLAKGFAGECYAHMGKYDEAIKQLESFSTKGDMTISPALTACLANCYAQKNQLDKAVSTFKEAAKMADNEGVSPVFLMEAARLLEAQNNKAEANKLYTQIQKDYPAAQVCQTQTQDGTVVEPEILKYIERTK